MQVFDTIRAARESSRQARAAGRRIGLVPTMGALHSGHFSLISRAVDECDHVVVSIFVNPTQFGPGEDLDAYPRTPDDDLEACRRLGADAVFMPAPEEMYGPGGKTDISVRELTEALCGASRPGHFTGVATVVAKLLNIVQPDRAYFGAKDFQQAAVIRRMVEDLNFPVEVVVCPTVRESDRLAMSSRNKYLSPAERKQAPELYAALEAAAERVRVEQPAAGEVERMIRERLAQRAPLGEIDYVKAVDPETMADVERAEPPVLLALAVRFGRARLIDNLLVEAEPANS